MVRIAGPPPERPIDPRTPILPAGTEFVRIYNPSYLGPDSYNHNGPRSRFDHHGPVTPPQHDPDHGTYYAAYDLAGCIIEVFGDAGVIEPDAYRVARVRTPRDLRLLQLEDGGAWDAGSVAAIAKTADRPLSQEWARYFYAAPAYGSVDGLRFENAHNDEPAFAFFERAGPFVVIDHWSLADPRLTAEIDAIALRLHLIVDR